MKKKELPEKVLVKAGTFRYKELPRKEWYTCKRCNGTGSIEESGDLHRSSGIVPCGKCHNGIVKVIEVHTKPVYRVKSRVE